MITLSYGYQLPETGEYGTTWFPNLEFDIQRLNDHSHNGIDSALLSSTSISPVSGTLDAADWVDEGGGTYSQLVTTPPSIDFDVYGLAFRITNGPDIGREIHPTVVKVANTQFTIYVNDNTIDLTVIYLV